MEDSDPDLWFRDVVNPNFVQLHRLRQTIYSGKTAFQSVEVIDTDGFGRCLILDGKIQSAEMDEFVYHEALVHPAMISHPDPRTVFVAGGGEGATAREALRHRSVQRVVMVDIDKQAVDICRRFLPSMHQGAFDDKRTEVLYLDAKEYLATSKQRFDVIIIDLTDPVEGGPSCMLYTQEFYRLARERLSPDGVLVLQAGSCSLEEFRIFVAVNKTLQSVFPSVFPYQAHIPSFGGLWGFALASQQSNALSLSIEEVDRRIAAGLSGNLKFYDGVTHRGLFCLPLYLRHELSRARTIVTNNNPLVTR